MSSDASQFKRNILRNTGKIGEEEILSAMKLAEEGNASEINYEFTGVNKDNGNIFYGAYGKPEGKNEISYWYEEVDIETSFISPRSIGINEDVVWGIWEALDYIENPGYKITEVFKVASRIYTTVSAEHTIQTIQIPKKKISFP